jgi:hypothetical protein
MAEQTDVEWPTCEQAGCIGICLASARMCLAHASDEETAAGLRIVGETGEIDARGVPITSALLGRILTAAPRGENDEPLIKGCRFDRATFSDDAQFSRARFNGNAKFDGATFNGDCRFAGAHNLDGLRLESDVRFATAPIPWGSGGRDGVGPAAPGRPEADRPRAARPGPARASRACETLSADGQVATCAASSPETGMPIPV